MDKYDREIEYLRQNPDGIYPAWSGPIHSAGKGGLLFQFLGPLGFSHDTPYGCVSQVKSGYGEAFSEKLTAKIRADSRVPADECDITVDHLPVFAEYQREADQLFRTNGAVAGES